MGGVGERPWWAAWVEVVGSLGALGREDLVCFDGGPGSPDEPCLVADSQALDEDEDVPPEAEARGWRTVIGKDEIEDVIVNLRRQIGGEPDMALVLRGVAHYVDNDAYLTVR